MGINSVVISCAVHMVFYSRPPHHHWWYRCSLVFRYHACGTHHILPLLRPCVLISLLYHRFSIALRPPLRSFSPVTSNTRSIAKHHTTAAFSAHTTGTSSHSSPKNKSCMARMMSRWHQKSMNTCMSAGFQTTTRLSHGAAATQCSSRARRRPSAPHHRQHQNHTSP